MPMTFRGLFQGMAKAAPQIADLYIDQMKWNAEREDAEFQKSIMREQTDIQRQAEERGKIETEGRMRMYDAQVSEARTDQERTRQEIEATIELDTMTDELIKLNNDLATAKSEEDILLINKQIRTIQNNINIKKQGITLDYAERQAFYANLAGNMAIMMDSMTPEGRDVVTRGVKAGLPFHEIVGGLKPEHWFDKEAYTSAQFASEAMYNAAKWAMDGVDNEMEKSGYFKVAENGQYYNKEDGKWEDWKSKDAEAIARWNAEVDRQRGLITMRRLSQAMQVTPYTENFEPFIPYLPIEYRNQYISDYMASQNMMRTNPYGVSYGAQGKASNMYMDKPYGERSGGTGEPIALRAARGLSNIKRGTTPIPSVDISGSLDMYAR